MKDDAFSRDNLLSLESELQENMNKPSVLHDRTGANICIKTLALTECDSLKGCAKLIGDNLLDYITIQYDE